MRAALAVNAEVIKLWGRYIKTRLGDFTTGTLREFPEHYEATFNAHTDWIFFQRDPCPLDATGQERTGWKCHVSIHPDDLSRAWPIVKKCLFDAELLSFKVITTPAGFKFGQGGKQLVAYTGFNFGIAGDKWEEAILNIEKSLRKAKIRRDIDPHPHADLELGHYTSYRNDYMDRDLLESLCASLKLHTDIDEERINDAFNPIFADMEKKRCSYITLKGINDINIILEGSGFSPLTFHNPSDIPADLAGDLKLDMTNYFDVNKPRRLNPLVDPFDSLREKLDRQASDDSKLARSKRYRRKKSNGQPTHKSGRMRDRKMQDVESSTTGAESIADTELEAADVGSMAKSPEAKTGVEQPNESPEVVDVEPDTGPDTVELNVADVDPNTVELEVATDAESGAKLPAAESDDQDDSDTGCSCCCFRSGR